MSWPVWSEKPIGKAALFGGAFLLGCAALGLEAARVWAASSEHRRMAAHRAEAERWLEAKPQLNSLMEKLLPGGLPGNSRLWIVRSLERTASQAGVELTNLRPTSTGVSEATVEGKCSAVAAFLRGLPQALPGAALGEIRLQASQKGIRWSSEVSSALAGLPAGGVAAGPARRPPQLHSLLEALADDPAFPLIKLDRIVAPAEVKPAAPPLAAGAVLQSLTLKGVLWSGTPRAYVEDKAAGRVLTVSAGDRVGPVEIQAIEPNRVVVELEGETYELRL